MSIVTAKIVCKTKAEAEDGQVALEFEPDYNDGRNAEWAKYTPGLWLAMTVKDAATAEHFEVGRAYELRFVPE